MPINAAFVRLHFYLEKTIPSPCTFVYLEFTLFIFIFRNLISLLFKFQNLCSIVNTIKNILLNSLMSHFEIKKILSYHVMKRIIL